MDYSTTIIPTAMACRPDTTKIQGANNVLGYSDRTYDSSDISDTDVLIQTLCQGAERKRKRIGTKQKELLCELTKYNWSDLIGDRHAGAGQETKKE